MFMNDIMENNNIKLREIAKGKALMEEISEAHKKISNILNKYDDEANEKKT